MNEKLRKYIEDSFAGAPNIKRTVELKEELIQNLTDKYNDLLAEGKTPEAAYNISVASVGDLSGLIEDLKKECMTADHSAERADRSRSAKFVTAAVMLYILSIPVIIMSTEAFGEIQGVTLFFVMIALATGLLIYNGMTRTSYKRKDDTLAEEFREWKSGNSDRIRARKAVSSAMWMLIVVAYFLVSFLTMRWAVTWILFLIGAAIEQIIKAVFELTQK